LLNGAPGTGKTTACLNLATMAAKSSEEARVLFCCTSTSSLIGVLQLIKRGDKHINHVNHLLNHLTIITEDRQSTEGLFPELLLEQKAMTLFMQQYSSNPKYSQLIDLIRRTKAAERLLQVTVKTRDGVLIDPQGSDEKNMKMIDLIENTFFTEEQATLWLN
jgi:predicted Rossmann fold nucleotide-binding protein DprA/Smf involved in DNA uptake